MQVVHNAVHVVGRVQLLQLVGHLAYLLGTRLEFTVVYNRSVFVCWGSLVLRITIGPCGATNYRHFFTVVRFGHILVAEKVFLICSYVIFPEVSMG